MGKEGRQHDDISPLQTTEDKSKFSPFQSGLDVTNAKPLRSTYGYLNKEALKQVSRSAIHFDWPVC